MPPFGRLITAMVTPMRADYTVDYDRAAELAERLVQAGNDGLVVSGTTGESPTLTEDEKLQLFRTVVAAVGGRARVVAGTGNYSTAESIALTRRAAETGVDGFLLVVPYYNKPPQEGLYQHFSAIAAATDKPCMLYNVPSRTSCNLLPATTARLARDHANIVAIKECVVEQVGPVLAETPPGFAVYSGDDAATMPMMAQGAVGVVSVAGHVCAPQLREMIQAFVNGEVDRAAALHRRLLPVFRGLFVTTNPILTKAALDLSGLPVGPLRPPLLEATAAEREALRTVLAESGLLH